MVVAAPGLQPLDPAADAARLHEAYRKWRRRSHLIRFLRRALPALMAAMVLALLAAVAVQTLGRRAAPEGEVAVRMLNPRFRGRDDEGRAFVLAAKAAVRDNADLQRVLLEGPELELTTDPERAPMRVTARSGLYLEGRQLMTLKGDVVLVDPNGWRFVTEEAVVDTRRDVISGRKRIEGVGPGRKISGDSYAIYNRGERVVLRGAVRSTISGG
jgi:lipopolysaccharide export system protein LptC